MHLWTNHPQNHLQSHSNHKNIQPNTHPYFSPDSDIANLENTAHGGTTLRPTVKYKT